MNKLICAIATAIVLSCICSCLVSEFNNVKHFRHSKPRERYPDIVREFGPASMVYVTDSSGIARWEYPSFYESIMLLDESITHKHPEPHCDFLYATVKVHIPGHIVPYVLSLSESIYYDRLKNLLTVRCHFMGAIVSTMILALDIVNDEQNWEKYHSVYGKLVASSMNPEVYLGLSNSLSKLVLLNKLTYSDHLNNTSCK